MTTQNQQKLNAKKIIYKFYARDSRSLQFDDHLYVLLELLLLKLT